MADLLIVNSGPKNIKPLLGFWGEVASRGHKLVFMTADPGLANSAKENGWRFKLIPSPPSLLAGKAGFILSACLSPLLYLWLWPVLFSFRKKQGVDTVVLFGLFEKLFMTLPAKISGMDVFWIELPAQTYGQKGLWRLFGAMSRACVRIFTLEAGTAGKLESLGLDPEKISTLPLAVNTGQYRVQGDIFQKIADSSSLYSAKKFFTLGVISPLDDPDKFDILFSAVKKCQTIIPRLQLIVVGEGRERKNLLCTTKKMGIADICWFVGRQKHLKKWLDSFNVMVSLSEEPDLPEITNAFLGQASGVPVIGPENSGLRHVFGEGAGLLYHEEENSESLTQLILRLQQNKILFDKSVRQARAAAEERFSVAAMADEFLKKIQ